MVAEMIKRHGLSVRRLSETLGVPRLTIQRWKKGRRPSATSRFLLRLIDIHGLDALLSGELAGDSKRKPLSQSGKRNASQPAKAGP